MAASSYFVALLVMFFKVLGVTSYAQLGAIDDAGDEFRHCVCVPYWQCKEDYSGLIDDSIDAIDIRGLRHAPEKPDGACTGDFDVCCKVQCGKKRSLPSSTSDITNRLFTDDDIFGFRILGENNNADFAEFPWMLGILKDRTYKCGASLIHPQVALTAAHCVSTTATTSYKIRAGEWNWEEITEPLPHQDRQTKKIIIHPEYYPGSLQNDIALVVLDTPFKLTENVGIACVPRKPVMYAKHSRCVATGWGKNSHQKGTYQSTLKKVELPIVPSLRCLGRLRAARLGPHFKLHKSFICAGGEPNKDTCKGDGGSPLVCPVPGQPDRLEQTGIVSWGLTCGLDATPGVYVNVALFSDWIDQQMMLHNFDTSVYRY